MLTRRRILQTAAAAALLPGTTAAGTVREDNAFPSALLGYPVRYGLYLPPGYDTDSRRYPVLYLLHGAGDGQPSDWFRMAGIDRLLDRAIAAGEIPPIVAIAPDGRRAAGDARATYFLDDADGSHPWSRMFTDQFIPHVETRHRVIGAAKQRALLGISMGGHAALLFQLRRPEAFAGMSALSAAFRTPEELAAMPQDAYEVRFGGAFGTGLAGRARLNDAWAQSDVLKAAAAADPARFARWPRIYITLAADDPFFAGNAAVHIALNEAGIPHRFTVTEGRHDWAQWQAALPEAIRHIGAVLTRQYGE